MHKAYIINTLRAELPKLKSDFGVKNIGLFGSCANHNQNQESDVDLLVELTPPYADNYFRLLSFPEQKFSVKIDLVRRGKHLGDKFVKQVESEVIYA